MEFVSNEKGEPMEIDKMQIEGEVSNATFYVLMVVSLCNNVCTATQCK